MARRHGEPRLGREAVEQRLGERRTLDGIGAGGDLVEEHERLGGRPLEDPDQVPQVGGEGREAHRDRLLVADVDEDLVEDGQRRLVRRWPQAALVERGGEPERLQRHGLAARVRPADHERPQAAELEVDRDGGGPLEQRMPRAAEDDLAARRHERSAPAA